MRFKANSCECHLLLCFTSPALLWAKHTFMCRIATGSACDQLCTGICSCIPSPGEMESAHASSSQRAGERPLVVIIPRLLYNTLQR